MRKTRIQTEDSGSEALSEIWAVPALMWFVLFIGLLALMSGQSAPDMSAELAADNVNLITAIDSAAAQASDARSQLESEQALIKQEREGFQEAIDEQSQALQQMAADAERQRDRAETAEQAVARAKDEAADATERAASASQRADRAENLLATRALVTQFVVDTSGSMSKEHQVWGDDTKTLVEALVPVAPLTVGAIAYLDSRRVFPLTRIYPKNEDGGRSLAALHRFIDGIKATGGNVDLIAATRDAMRRMNATPNRSARRTIAIFSDVSVYETQDEAAATNFIRDLGSWVRSDERNAVLVVYTGDNARDRRFYKRLADAGGPRITVTENLSRTLPELLRAMTSR